MKIPNKISLVLIAAFAVCALAAGLSYEAIGQHFAVGAAVLAVTFTLFVFNTLGGGDAKLMAAGALWMGPALIIEYLAILTIFGGILAMVVLCYRKFVPAQNLSLPGWAHRLHAQGTGIPYGIAIAASGLVNYPSIEIFRALSQ